MNEKINVSSWYIQLNGLKALQINIAVQLRSTSSMNSQSIIFYRQLIEQILLTQRHHHHIKWTNQHP